MRFVNGLLTFVLVLMLLMGSAAYLFDAQVDAPGPLERAKTVIIAKGKGTHEIAEHRSPGCGQRIFSALRENPHGAAAHQSRIPGELFGEFVSAQHPAAVAQHLPRGQNRVRLDASAAEGPGRSAARIVISHNEFGAHDLRRAALGPDDGGQRKLLAGLFQLGHPDEK